LCTAFFGLLPLNAFANENVPTQENDAQAKESHHAGHSHVHEQPASSVFGQPGDLNNVDRVIKMQTLDTMKYDEEKIVVMVGETIKFIVTNTGKTRHEFMIGDKAEQKEHARMMKRMPNMVHEDENTLTLEPGQTKTLVWQFTKPGIFEIACHIPGHYEAGMISKVRVESSHEQEF
jgi:uncharacterized cupredoxin-like copper-binding protein